MERERFLDAVAQRLGRSRLRAAPARPRHEVNWPTIEGSLVERFQAELERVGGTMSRADSLAEVTRQLGDAVAASGPERTIAAARTEFEAFGLDTTGPAFLDVSFWGDTSFCTRERFRQRAFLADLGITTVALAVASTGTLILTASHAMPRSVSLLPRRHLALLAESQIVPHLGAALSPGAVVRPGSEALPSALLCITGPSRTSDIENDLSIGVHGPAEVHVILCGGARA